MEQFDIPNLPKFESPEEEIAFLRAHIEKKEHELQGSVEKEKITKETLNIYKDSKKDSVLHNKINMSTHEVESLVLRLAPESHDNTMEELLGILLTKGIKNAMEVVEGLKNAHIQDDFHRFLVQYLINTHKIPGLKEGNNLWKSLNKTLFEVTLPDKNPNDPRSFKDIISTMEQFFAGMQYIGEDRDNKGNDIYTLEISTSHNSGDVVFYVGVPKEKSELFEKQLLSIHPLARINEVPDDYNIFSEGNENSFAYAHLEQNDVIPLKTYEQFDRDTIEIFINSFNKISNQGEGAGIQFVIRPCSQSIIKHFTSLLEKAKKGEEVKKEDSPFGDLAKEFGGILLETFFNKEEKKEEDKKINESLVSNIQKKLESTITNVNIRIVTSSKTRERSNMMLSDIEASFSQFSLPGGNSIKFINQKDKKLYDSITDFSFRNYKEETTIILNHKELATLVHFPYGVTLAPQLKTARAGSGSVPSNLPQEGVLLGYNVYRGVSTEVHILPEDRMRHLYVIGQTGTGKTSILKNLIAQDIARGDGVCYIDPHGNDIQDILSYIPKERVDDVIYFDPSYMPRPMGLNMLEFDPNYPEQKTFVVNDLLGIFNQLFDLKSSGGPMFEQYFRNAAFLVMEDVDSGCTLLEITRVLQDKAFRDYKLSKCKNPIIKQFWIAAEASKGEQGLENFVTYISSKFDPFISNDIMRPVIGQEKSAFNFREIMDNKKILLVNLSKGRLGDINANLIGLILVGKLQQAALSRVDLFGKQINDFYLYIDEFQNVTTPAISSILSEARKYRLSLNVAHQYIAQLSEDTKNAIFGNVGSMCVFRVSPDDATYLEPKFAPTFTSNDITQLENRNAYTSMIVNGTPTSKPFNIITADNPKGNKDIIGPIKELSYMKFGRPREEVDEIIIRKYNK
jgi:hypothetical protein